MLLSVHAFITAWGLVLDFNFAVLFSKTLINDISDKFLAKTEIDHRVAPLLIYEFLIEFTNKVLESSYLYLFQNFLVINDRPNNKLHYIILPVKDGILPKKVCYQEIRDPK